MWLEIIQIRADESRLERLIKKMTEILPEIEERSTGIRITLLRHSSITSDISLHLGHEADIRSPEKSDMGQILAGIAGEYGLVNHDVWMVEQPRHHE